MKPIPICIIYTVICILLYNFGVGTETLSRTWTGRHLLQEPEDDDDYQAMRGMIILNQRKYSNSNHAENDLHGSESESMSIESMWSESESELGNKDKKNHMNGEKHQYLRGYREEKETPQNQKQNQNTGDHDPVNGDAYSSNSNNRYDTHHRTDDDFHFIIPLPHISHLKEFQSQLNPNSNDNSHGLLRSRSNFYSNPNVPTSSALSRFAPPPPPPPPREELEELVFFNRHITQPKHDQHSFDRAFPLKNEELDAVQVQPREKKESMDLDPDSNIELKYPRNPEFITPVDIEEKIDKPPDLPKEWE